MNVINHVKIIVFGTLSAQVANEKISKKLYSHVRWSVVKRVNSATLNLSEIEKFTNEI